MGGTDFATKDIEERLAGLKGREPGLILQEHVKRAAVVIPLIRTDAGLEVLFEVRSSRIGRQPGDVCFPGGVKDKGETYLDAAVREACEELLIKPENLEIICECDIFHNANTAIHPFAAYLSGYRGTFSSDEVSEVFTVPLSFFLDTEPLVYQAEMRVIRGEGFPYHLIAGGENYKWPKRIDDELFYDWNGRTVWGISARIIKGFADTIRAFETQ